MKMAFKAMELARHSGQAKRDPESRVVKVLGHLDAESSPTRLQKQLPKSGVLFYFHIKNKTFDRIYRISRISFVPAGRRGKTALTAQLPRLSARVRMEGEVDYLSVGI